MAISYVGGKVAGRSNPSSDVSIAIDSGLTGGSGSAALAGDLVIVAAVTGSAGGTPAMAVTTPTGYTAIGQENQNDTADTSMNVSWKIMGGTPDTTVTIPGTGNNAFGEAYSIQVFRGVDTTTPMDVAAQHTGGIDTGRPDPPSITPTTTGAAIVICGGGAAGTGANYTAPANYTTNFITASGADTTDAMVGSGYRLGMTGGVPENPAGYTGGTTGSGDSWAAYTLALRPIAAVTHDGTGALTGPGSTVAGAASSATPRPSDGALTGPGAVISGTAARTREHATDGALVGPGALLEGAADRQDGAEPVTHDSSGALVGAGSEVVGAASSATTRSASGAIVGPGAVVAGSAARTGAPVVHDTSGALVGPGALIVGAAGRPADTSQAGLFDIPTVSRRAVHHAASGRIVGRGAKLSAAARVSRTGQNALALLMSHP